MKKASVILLILLIPLAAAETFSFENGVEAEVEEASTQFNITPVEPGINGSVYNSFKVESNGFTNAQLSFNVPAHRVDTDGFRPSNIVLVDEETRIYPTEGSFEKYTAHITKPGNYYVTVYSEKTLAQGDGECSEFIEVPENFTEVEECSTESRPAAVLSSVVDFLAGGTAVYAILLYVFAGIAAILVTVRTAQTLPKKLIDRVITWRTHQLTSGNASEEKLETVMEANEKASNDNHMAAFKALLKTIF